MTASFPNISNLKFISFISSSLLSGAENVKNWKRNQQLFSWSFYWCNIWKSLFFFFRFASLLIKSVCGLSGERCFPWTSNKLQFFFKLFFDVLERSQFSVTVFIAFAFCRRAGPGGRCVLCMTHTLWCLSFEMSRDGYGSKPELLVWQNTVTTKCVILVVTWRIDLFETCGCA